LGDVSVAHLDPFLQVMFDKQAEALALGTDQQVMLEVHEHRHPITKEPLSGPQVLGLLKEIVPDGMRQQLEGGDGRVTFGYLCQGRQVDVETDRSGETITAVFSPAKPRRSTSAISMPAEALLMEPAPAAAPAVSTTPPAAVADVAPAHALRASSEMQAAAAAAEERIQELLNKLVESGSSDLHLRVGLPPTYRTAGDLVPMEGAAPLGKDDIETMLLAIMPDRNRHEYTESNDSDFAYEMVDVARFRVNALKDRMGPAAVFRVIPTTIMSVDELGLSEEVKKLCHLTKGLVLVTGPTGSGKSTTLAAMIDLINQTRSEHVLTIEDPIEFVHQNKKCVVTQRQVGSHTQSFKRALRAALREDPDVVMIGEMRDLETVAIAIETAETGHLVFGTLHTTTAPSTIDRIIDQFPSDQQDQIRVMLSESLRGVISQVLVKTTDGSRIAAREILITNNAVSNLIREGKTFQLPSIIQTNKKLGMISLNDSLVDLIVSKKVEAHEAYMKSADKAGMEQSLRQLGVSLDFKQ
jgi:twitching motility protein PilT